MSRETEGADTLEDWRQCAKVEAGLRREAHAEIARLRGVLQRIVDNRLEFAKDWAREALAAE